MIQDLHSHTYYSFCGHDTPEDVITAAISGGVALLGITDHNYGIALQRSTNEYTDPHHRNKDYQRSLDAYLSHMRLLAHKFSKEIQVLCGIEIATASRKNWDLPESIDLSGFDYCLIESIDTECSAATDLFSFAKRCATKYIGVAHTDLFSYLDRTGQDHLSYFSKMANEHIFWEMNVNFDSTHHYRQHQYVLDFFENPQQQEIILRSGVQLSVGFDGHRTEDYRPDIIRDYCEKIQKLNIPLAFSCEPL